MAACLRQGRCESLQDPLHEVTKRTCHGDSLHLINMSGISATQMGFLLLGNDARHNVCQLDDDLTRSQQQRHNRQWPILEHSSNLQPRLNPQFIRDLIGV